MWLTDPYLEGPDGGGPLPIGEDMTRRRVAIILVALVGLLVVLANLLGKDGVISRFMLKPDRIIVERRPDRFYDVFFPYYVELCATSQFRSK